MKLKRNYVWWGVLGNVIQYGIPLSYIVYRYEIFQFKEAQTSLTGWGMIGAMVAFFMFRNKIKMFVEDYNKHLGMTAQKGKWGIFFLTMFGVLALASLWIHGMMWFAFAVGVSNLISLLAYKPYFDGKKNYLEDKDFLKKEQREQRLKSVSI